MNGVIFSLRLSNMMYSSREEIIHRRTRDRNIPLGGLPIARPWHGWSRPRARRGGGLRGWCSLGPGGSRMRSSGEAPEWMLESERALLLKRYNQSATPLEAGAVKSRETTQLLFPPLQGQGRVKRKT